MITKSVTQTVILIVTFILYFLIGEKQLKYREYTLSVMLSSMLTNIVAAFTSYSSAKYFVIFFGFYMISLCLAEL